jgi:hypothetical protein
MLNVKKILSRFSTCWMPKLALITKQNTVFEMIIFNLAITNLNTHSTTSNYNTTGNYVRKLQLGLLHGSTLVRRKHFLNTHFGPLAENYYTLAFSTVPAFHGLRPGRLTPM